MKPFLQWTPKKLFMGYFLVFLLFCIGIGSILVKADYDPTYNYIPNGDCENDIRANWWAWNDTSTGAVASTMEQVNNIPGFSGYCLHFTATNCGNGAYSWSDYTEQVCMVNFNNRSTHLGLLNLAAGKSYVFSIKASANRNGGRINIAFPDPNPPDYTRFHEFPIYPTTTPTVYSTMITNITQTQISQLIIFFGNTTTVNNNGINFYVDDIQLTEVPQALPQPLPVIDSTIPNGNFEADIASSWGWYNDTAAGAVTPTLEQVSNIPGFSGNCLHFSATSCGNAAYSWSDYTEQLDALHINNPNNLSLLYLGWGKSYKFSIKASADKAGGRLNVVLQNPNPPNFNRFCEFAINPTTVPTVYTTTFTNMTSDELAEFCIFFGNTANANNNGINFYIDDVQITEQATGTLPTVQNIVAIAGGGAHNLALKSDGTILAWGLGYQGQLGNGSNNNYNIPVTENNMTGVTAIAAGNLFSMALKNDGTVWTWGSNDFGELGNGSNTASNIPAPVYGLSGIIAIAAGDFHGLALRNDGTVWAWGGALGSGTGENSNIPVQISGLSGVIAIAGGNGHSLALKNDGTVWAWGMNGFGELGIGSNTDSYTPVQVTGLNGVIAIAAGGYHSLALKNDGTVWAWGDNDDGQVGNSSNTDINIPVQVSGLSGVIAISAKENNSQALKSDGTVWAWGSDDYNQLGDGSKTNRNYPIQVNDLSGVIATSCGGQHGLVLKNDGTVWDWGDNEYGQLGNGINTDSYIPVQAGEPTSGIAPYQYALAVTSDGNGYTSPSGNIIINSSISSNISATPKSGYQFVNWTKTGGTGTVTFGNPTSASTTVTVTGGNAIIRANFAGAQNILTVTNNGHGSTNPVGNVTLSDGASIPITATPSNNYHFVNWTKTAGTGTVTFGNATSANTTVTVTGGNATIQANFAIDQYSLTLTDDGNGSTTPAGTIIVDSGSATTITAFPNTNYHFVNWTQTGGTGTVVFSDPTSASTTVTITGDNATIQANFAINQCSLTLITDGIGGTTTAGAITVDSGSATTITAIPHTNYHFVNWTKTGGTGTVVFGNETLASTYVTVTGGNAIIQANFDEGSYNLIQNGDFESDIYNTWGPWYDTANGAGTPRLERVSNIPGFSGNCLHFSATSCGNAQNPWYDYMEQVRMLNNQNRPCYFGLLNLVAGKSYLISVKAAADRDGGRINIVLPDPNPPAYTRFHEFPIYPTTTPTVYSTMITNITQTQASQLIIFYGNTTEVNNDGINFYVDDIQVTEVPSAPPLPAPVIDSWIMNGDFENDIASSWGWYNDTAAGAVTPTLEQVSNIPGFSGNCLRFSLANCGNGSETWSDYAEQIDALHFNNPYNLSFLWLGWGKSYKVSLKVSADRPGGRLNVVLQNPNPPNFNRFNEFVINPTTVPTVYTTTFTNMTSDEVAQFCIFFGNTVTANNNGIHFYVDDVQITEQATGTLPAVQSIVAIAGGGFHNLALKNDGTILAWGLGDHGQLGNGLSNNYNIPVTVNNLTGVTAVAAGNLFSMALKNDGTIWAWGCNDDGELGNGSNITSNIPVSVYGLSGVIAIAAGDFHGLALKNDGTVWAWGSNNQDLLGTGTNVDSNIPVQVSGLSGVIAIAGGNGYSLALRNDGTVWAWGINDVGELGNGSNTDSYTPVQVTGLNGVIAIAAGACHNLALKNDGTVWAWGYNLYGQLGNGSNEYFNIPVQVSGLSGVIAISAKENNSQALKSDGTVWAWGSDDYNQLGDGSKTNRNYPIQVNGLSGVIAISCGGKHGLVLKNDGTVWDWGYNEWGQLGNGINTDSYIPVQAGEPTSGIAPYQYALTVTNDGNGYSGPTGSITVNSGVSSAISATPKAGYRFVNWTKVGGTGTATFADPTLASTIVTVTGGNVTVQANFAIQYTLTVSSNGYGSTDPSGDVMFGNGANINVNAAPNGDYHFANWTKIGGTGTVVFGDSTSANTTITVTGGDAVIQANFGINQYALTVNSDGNGSITPSGNATVNSGTGTSITATPNGDYHFVNWTQIGGSGTVVFGDPTATTTTVIVTGGDATIQANFAINQYTLTVNSFGKGNITPSGNITVKSGAETLITATPNGDCHFVNWKQTGGNGTVVFGDPTAATTTVIVTGGDVTIQADFAINQYALTVNSDGNGSITPSGNTTVNSGAGTSITATPNGDYHFVNWTKIGGTGTVVFSDSTSASTTVTITGGDAVVQANFAINQYALTVNSDGNGSITPSGNTTVNNGAGTSITATPNADYHFVNWTQIGGSGTVVFGDPTSATTTVTITGGDAVVQANFEINQYVLTITNLWGGRTTPSGKITVNSGANTLLTATPNNNYHFVRWVQIGGKGKVIFGNPTSATTTATMTGGNTTILAFFAPGKTKECDTTL